MPLSLWAVVAYESHKGISEIHGAIRSDLIPTWEKKQSSERVGNPVWLTELISGETG